MFRFDNQEKTPKVGNQVQFNSNNLSPVRRVENLNMNLVKKKTTF